MLDRGYIGASELALLRVADDPEDVVKITKEARAKGLRSDGKRPFGVRFFGDFLLLFAH
jgi:hypothetical protein